MIGSPNAECNTFHFVRRHWNYTRPKLSLHEAQVITAAAQHGSESAVQALNRGTVSEKYT